MEKGNNFVAFNFHPPIFLIIAFFESTLAKSMTDSQRPLNHVVMQPARRPSSAGCVAVKKCNFCSDIKSSNFTQQKPVQECQNKTRFTFSGRNVGVQSSKWPNSPRSFAATNFCRERKLTSCQDEQLFPVRNKMLPAAANWKYENTLLCSFTLRSTTKREREEKLRETSDTFVGRPEGGVGGETPQHKERRERASERAPLLYYFLNKWDIDPTIQQHLHPLTSARTLNQPKPPFAKIKNLHELKTLAKRIYWKYGTPTKFKGYN